MLQEPSSESGWVEAPALAGGGQASKRRGSNGSGAHARGQGLEIARHWLAPTAVAREGLAFTSCPSWSVCYSSHTASADRNSAIRRPPNRRER